jgi:magnesium chelatase family protein
MLAKTFGFVVHGVDARTILIEVNVAQGTRFFMSELPENAFKGKPAADRVRSQALP